MCDVDGIGRSLRRDAQVAQRAKVGLPADATCPPVLCSTCGYACANPEIGKTITLEMRTYVYRDGPLGPGYFEMVK